MGTKHQSVISNYSYSENRNGSVSYRALVTSEGTMGKRRGEQEWLTGVILPGQNIRERIKHQASVRGFGNARFSMNFTSTGIGATVRIGRIPEW